MILDGFSVNLFIVAILAAIGGVGLALVRQVLVFSGRRAALALEKEISVLSRRHDALLREQQAAETRVRATEEERRVMAVQIEETRRRLALAAQDNFDVIHELSEPGFNRRLFVGLLAVGPSVTINGVTASHCPLRKARNILEIWAETQADATRLAKQVYPPESGFAVNNLRLHSAPGTETQRPRAVTAAQ